MIDIKQPATIKGQIESKEQLNQFTDKSKNGDIYIQPNHIDEEDGNRYIISWIFCDKEWHILRKDLVEISIRYVCEQCSRKCSMDIHYINGIPPEICPFYKNEQKAKWMMML